MNDPFYEKRKRGSRNVLRVGLLVVNLLLFLLFLLLSLFSIGTVVTGTMVNGQVTETVVGSTISPIIPLAWLVLIVRHVIWVVTTARREHALADAQNSFEDKPKRDALILGDDGELIAFTELDEREALQHKRA
ncbi:MAG: hypothetical protein IT320_18045 [Anaerolineae bacterium]|nr:hypothetical protein [Anaerolineae bacterium]